MKRTVYTFDGGRLEIEIKGDKVWLDGQELDYDTALRRLELMGVLARGQRSKDETGMTFCSVCRLKYYIPQSQCVFCGKALRRVVRTAKHKTWIVVE